jgi:outer membrane protein
MKNFLLPLNIALLLAVGVLYYFQFSKKSSTALADHKCDNSAKCTNAKMGYFNMDTLESQYEYAKDVRSSLDEKEKGLYKSLEGLKQQYVAQVKEFQQKGPTLSQQEQGQYQQRLMQLQNEYTEKEQLYSREMQSETMRRLSLIKNKIQDLLKDYSKQHGFSFIMATSEGDNLYYKDSTFNITPDVIKVLNDDYKRSKQK